MANATAHSDNRALFVYDPASFAWSLVDQDASNLDEDGHEHACGWYSALLTPAMTKWATSDRELWALVASTRHWRVHLQRGHLVYIVRWMLTTNSRATR